MSDYKYILSNANISSNGGFSFVSKLLESNFSMKRWNLYRSGAPQQQHTNLAVVKSTILMQCAGASNFSDIRKFCQDCLFKAAVGGAVPSEATYRQRLNELAAGDWQSIIDSCVSYQLSKAKLTSVEVAPGLLKLIPVDIDVSVFEDVTSHKEGVAMTYHRVNGYAPIFAYAGVEGFQVAAELRPGNQHCENGAVDFLKRTVAVLTAAGYEPGQLLIRVDSGHDAAEFIQACIESKVHFIIKHNLRRISPEQLLDSIRYYEEPEICRPGKVIYRGIRSDITPADMETYRGFLVVEAVERTILANGQQLLIPKVDLDSWWTDLPCSVAQCVRQYHEHGTSEQFHSEMKSDLGIEQLPSGKFRTNAFFLAISTIAYNCMRRIGQLALEETPFPKEEDRPTRFRLRTVLLDLIKVGCKLVKHAGSKLLTFGTGCFNFLIIKKIYARC